MSEVPDREPADDFRCQEWHRLQPHDPVMGTLWVGATQFPATQSVWGALEDFRRYVNLLIEVYGHTTYGELRQMKEKGADEAEANAKLIAAAPDLLEVLKAIVVAARIDAPKNNAWQTLIADCAAAIAKATGK